MQKKCGLSKCGGRSAVVFMAVAGCRGCRVRRRRGTSPHSVGVEKTRSAGLVLACSTAPETPFMVGLLEGVHLIVHAGTEIHGRWHCH